MRTQTGLDGGTGKVVEVELYPVLHDIFGLKLGGADDHAAENSTGGARGTEDRRKISVRDLERTVTSAPAIAEGMAGAPVTE